MGQLRFSVSPPECITEEVLQFAYISGMDRTPWVVFAEADDNELVLERDVGDSGCATIPWHVEGHGVLMLSTGTLMERWEPYHLPLELARGTINQLRNQLFEWQSIGLDAPDEVIVKLREAVLLFSAAAVAANGSGAAKAQSALQCALDTGRILAASYAEQAIAVRRRGTGRLPSILGSQINGPLLDEATSGPFLTSFNMALVKMLWRDVEIVEGKYNWTQYDRQVDWCRAKGLRVGLGPLVQFDTSGLPDWVYIWEDDFDALQSAANQFVEAAVKRYRGKVDLWLCAARFNTSHVLKLSEDDKLRFVADLICLVKRLDPERARTISIDQPIGEYMGRRGCDFSPIQFVDALVRARIDIKAVLLEMNFGRFNGATLPKSELEVSRLLDYWSLLNLPLLVSISAPGGVGIDPLAQRKIGTPTATWTVPEQKLWADRYLPLILAKSCVQAVLWNQFHDGLPHDLPHAGLWTAQGTPKPALQTFTAMRAAYLTPHAGG